MLQCKLSQQENMNIIFLMLEGFVTWHGQREQKKNMFFLFNSEPSLLLQALLYLPKCTMKKTKNP